MITIIPACENDRLATYLQATISAKVLDLDDTEWEQQPNELVVDLGCEQHNLNVDPYQVVDIMEVVNIIANRHESQTMFNYASVIKELEGRLFL